LPNPEKERFMTAIGRRHFVIGAPALLRAAIRRPNVLWIMTDEHRPDSLRCYGSKWAYSPNLDRLAESGVLFESAYTPSPVCVPARCALLTGNYGSTTGVLHNQARLSPDVKFLTWSFEQAGYWTASFGKKHYIFPGGRQAFQTERGSTTDRVVDAESYGTGYDPAKYDAVQYPASPSRYIRHRWILAGKFPEPISESAEDKNVNLALRWLEQRDESKPFLLRLSLNAPHTPVVAPERFLRLIDPKRIDLPVASNAEIAHATARVREYLRDFSGAQQLSPADLVKARHYYYARVAFADYEIGRLLDWMRARALLASTIIVMTADHGADLGDHGLLQKQTFYEQVVTVPYLIAWKGLGRSGVRVRTAVSTIGLLPTVMQAAGIACPAVEAHPIAGVSPPAAPVFSELQFGYQKYRDADRQVMIREGRFKMSLFMSGEPDGELYDLERDPLERENLFNHPSHAGIAAHLKSAVVEWDRSRGLTGAAS
jgi:choline-sulfatase